MMLYDRVFELVVVVLAIAAVMVAKVLLSPGMPKQSRR